MKTGIFKCFVFILNKSLDYYHVLNIAFVIILLIFFLLLLLLLQLSFCYYIVQTPLPPPTDKPPPSERAVGVRRFQKSKLMAIGDLKNFARKRGLVNLKM